MRRSIEGSSFGVVDINVNIPHKPADVCCTFMSSMRPTWPKDGQHAVNTTTSSHKGVLNGGYG